MSRILPTLLLLIAAAACGKEESTIPPTNQSPLPSVPAPPAPPPVDPNSWSISGRVVETLTGVPVPNASLDFEGFGPIQADRSGAFSFASTTQPPFSPYRVTVTSPGYFAR